MSDLRIQCDEEMVGAGHATKADTLNRLFMGGTSPTFRDTDGKVLYNLFKKQATAPSTGVDEGALYAKEDAGGELKLYWRRPNNGEEVELGLVEVVDQGVDALTWSSGAATIPLAAPVDLDHHLLRLETGGNLVNPAGWYAWLEESQIQVRTISGANGIPGPVSWQVVRVPTGRVQRGRDTVTADTSGYTNDIVLTHAIDLDRAVISLLHRGRHLGYDATVPAYFSGYLQKHATDPNKLQAVMTADSGGPSGTLSWECWTP